MKDNTYMAGSEAEQSQPTDRPYTGNKADSIVGKVTITSPDLTKKDAGKWMSAWRMATNVYYPDVSPLFDLYTYVLGIDNTLKGLIKKRHTPVLNKKIVYYKPDGSQEDAMDTFLASTKFRLLKEKFLWAKQYGRGGVEFIVGKEFDFKEVPVKHIKTKWQIISTEQVGNSGYDYTQYWNIFIIDNGDLGDLLSCSLAAAYKKDAVGDWAELIEGFAQPTQVIWYKLFNDQVQKELDYILENAGSAKRIKLPEGTQYEQFENKGGNATGDAQLNFIDILNKEMQVCQLGGTETTGTSKGSGSAQAEVHYKVQQEVVKEDMDYLLGLINDARFIKVLHSYGLPVVEGGYFDFDHEVDVEYIGKFKEILKTAKELNLKVSTKFAYEAMAIPKPEDGDEVLNWADATIVEEEEQETPTQKPAKKKPVKKQPENLRDSVPVQVANWFKSFFA